MIVNLYVDHMMYPSPRSADEVWNATMKHPKIYRDAAAAVGMTPSEYREFLTDLQNGKAKMVSLPHHLDAMSGDRNGSIYAVKHAVLPHDALGWKVQLADGAQVYVPQACGNLSLLRGAPRVAKLMPYVASTRTHLQPAKQIVPITETPVTFDAPVSDVIVPEAPAAAITPVSPTSHFGLGWFGIPVVGGLIAAFTHGSTPTTPVPNCSNGSNAVGVCTK